MIQIGAPLASDFGDPLGVLRDCHRRIERFLETLITVTSVANGGPLSPEQGDALETALRYFDEAAPQHTADEEESLFPRLKALHNPLARGVTVTVTALESEHRIAAAAHAAVGTAVRRWLTDGRLCVESVREVAARLNHLQSIYTRHIAIEDGDVFPLARALLSASDVRAIGREMAGRRGLDASVVMRRAG